ncbi:hypothetical protein AYI68_g3463 [Smittium mucronatum]|uniref:Uncharacterized protein n=1 Tax=Smittium mucronatum TaxID=133383 RepID=A0A1R0GZV1_9FUNG|nr:hypothetical protein AYI68_g3463 [Smittium mucronatum]
MIALTPEFSYLVLQSRIDSIYSLLLINESLIFFWLARNRGNAPETERPFDATIRYGTREVSATALNQHKPSNLLSWFPCQTITLKMKIFCGWGQGRGLGSQ